MFLLWAKSHRQGEGVVTELIVDGTRRAFCGRSAARFVRFEDRLIDAKLEPLAKPLQRVSHTKLPALHRGHGALRGGMSSFVPSGSLRFNISLKIIFPFLRALMICRSSRQTNSIMSMPDLHSTRRPVVLS